MVDRLPKPDVDWDALYSSPDVRELLRYRKAGRTRTYTLRVLGIESAELWVLSQGDGKEMKSRKLVAFTNPDEVVPFLESVEQELRTGGWVQV